jgi:hypothetical protein
MQPAARGLRGGLGKLVVAEVGLPRPGGDDQRVVGDDVLPAEQLGGHRPGVEVDVGDPAEQDRRVLLRLRDLTGRRGDLARGQDALRDLLQQWREQVVRRLAHHGDVDVGVLEGLGPEQSTEPGPDRHDLVTI